MHSAEMNCSHNVHEDGWCHSMNKVHWNDCITDQPNLHLYTNHWFHSRCSNLATDMTMETDWFEWVFEQVLSLSSFGFLAIQGHFSVLILVLDIVRLIIADPHFLHSLGTLQSSFLFGWSSSTERERLVWSHLFWNRGIKKTDSSSGAWRTVHTSLDVSLVGCASSSSSSAAFLFLPTVTARKQKEDECLLLTFLKHQTSPNHWNISENILWKYLVYSTGFAIPCIMKIFKYCLYCCLCQYLNI